MLEEQDFALEPKRMLFEQSEFILFGSVFSEILSLLALLPPKPEHDSDNFRKQYLLTPESYIAKTAWNL